MVPIARNPDRCEGRISTASDDLNHGEEAIEDVHPARRGEEGDEDDTVLPYTVVEKDADGHDTRGTRCYLQARSRMIKGPRGV